MRQDAEQTRWTRRPGWARLVRFAVFCAPILASFGAALAVRTALPTPDGLVAQAGALAILVGVSTLVLLLVDRLGRRALPLVTLLDLTMLFPDRAPSRLGIARDAIRRRPIEEQLRRVQEAGADPSAVAREILGLVAAMSAHDRPTRGHAERVRMFTDLLAEQMNIPSRDRDLLRWASILHDIGKLRVPASLLNKPAKPTEDEWALLKAHPTHGAEMAAALLPWLGEWGSVIVEHHERYDGTGYPNGIAGRQISTGARIVSVADAYDVMTAVRAYKRPISRAAACRELVRFSGTQFDPAVVRAMVAVGAPRLRRAQGVVAWIADIPLVATGTVPVATVARVVGAGAFATGAVTGGVAVGGVLDAHPRAATAITVSDSAPDRANGPAGDATTPPRPERDAARTTPGPDPAVAPTSAATLPVEPVPPTAAEPVPVGSGAAPAESPVESGSGSSGSGSSGSGSSGSGSSDSGSSDSGSSGSGSGSSGSGGSTPSPTPTAKATKAPVAQTVDKVTGTVGTTAGTVTGTVGAVVNGPVGTGTGVANNPVGSGTTNPSPSPSPTASSGSGNSGRGGLLGGVLGGLRGG